MAVGKWGGFAVLLCIRCRYRRRRRRRCGIRNNMDKYAYCTRPMYRQNPRLLEIACACVRARPIAVRMSVKYMVY